MEYHSYSQAVNQTPQTSQPVKMKHSGYGISSFVLSIINGLTMFLLVIIAGYAEATTPGGMDETSLVAMVVGLGMFGTFFFGIVPLALGIIGTVVKERKKVFGILGILFTIFPTLALAGLILIGLLAA